MSRQYSIDLNLTDRCNMQCKYCFEKKHHLNNADNFSDVGLFINKIRELLDSEFFNTNYDRLMIGFWGGEPTLAYETIIEIFKAFEANSKVHFLIYSNGYILKEPLFRILYDYRKRYIAKDTLKIIQQISYDGNPIHDKYRLFSNQYPTSQNVLDNIKRFQRSKVPYVIKATLPINAFDYLEEAYLDFEKVLDLDNTDYYHSLYYFPTIDHHTDRIDVLKEDRLELECQALRKNLINIAKHELKRDKPYFAWFKPSRNLCCAGKDLVCIDVDSKVYTCHGVLYSPMVKDHYITSLLSEDWVKSLSQWHNLFSEINYEPEECKNCYASFCLRCNAVKYENSLKTPLLERWRDYPNQKPICIFYRINAKIVSAINLINKREHLELENNSLASL